MGIDVKYQAMPGTFPAPLPITDDIGDDIVTVCFAIEYRGVFRGPPPSDATRRIYETVARPILRSHPGIEQRMFYEPSRGWDALHWLLSPERRKTGRSMSGEDIGSAFVCGARAIEGAKATQGMPIRITPADTVASVLRFAETIDEGELRRTLANEPFVDVYKRTPRAELDEESWRHLMDYVADLRRVHSAAAAHGEALVVVFD